MKRCWDGSDGLVGSVKAVQAALNNTSVDSALAAAVLAACTPPPSAAVFASQMSVKGVTSAPEARGYLTAVALALETAAAVVPACASQLLAPTAPTQHAPSVEVSEQADEHDDVDAVAIVLNVLAAHGDEKLPVPWTDASVHVRARAVLCSFAEHASVHEAEVRCAMVLQRLAQLSHLFDSARH